jgi:hypothetical protein
MSNHRTRVAPALLAALLTTLAAAVPARTEPAAAAAANAADDCLTKPNAAAAQGSHWYYHLDRASGRRCWYQRPQGAKTTASDDAGARTVAAPAASPSAAAAAPPAASAVVPQSDPQTENADSANVIPPISSAPSESAAWPNAPAAAPEPVPATVDNAAPPAQPPAIDTTHDLPVAQADAGSPPLAGVERPAAAVDDSSHMPAVLGTLLALAIIILGSLIARQVSKLIRPRRQRTAERPRVSSSRGSNWDEPLSRLQLSQPNAPIAPRRSDIARETYAPPAPVEHPGDEWEHELTQEPRRVASDGPDRESARVLEDNVRELLHRLQTDLQAQPQGGAARVAPANRAHAHHTASPTAYAPPAYRDLDAALSDLREKRRR